MTEQKERLGFWESTQTIPFLKDTGYLGAGTNGAMPERAYGIWIEAEITETQFGEKDDHLESLWVKIATEEGQLKDRMKRDGEHFMYGNFEQVEKVLSAMLTASLHQTEIKPEGKFDAYMNRAQIDFDEENSTEECIYGVAARVAIGKTGGVDVSFTEPPKRRGLPGQVVARLNADFSSEGWSMLATEFRKLRVWREECLREISKASREREQEAAPAAPTM
jgi:hypothetical protein